MNACFYICGGHINIGANDNRGVDSNKKRRGGGGGGYFLNEIEETHRECIFASFIVPK